MKNSKKFFTSIIVMLFAVITIFTLSACENSNGSHCQHQWVDADCLYPKTCRLCSETEGQSLGHSWQEPTCTTPKICTRCHKTEGEALGHSFSTQYSKDVSNHWYECYCGEKTDVKAHVWDKGIVTKEPSETEKGTTLYTCVCGQTKIEDIEMLEHIHKFDDILSNDNTHHWYPSTCGHDDSITKIEHKYNWTTQSDATCEDAEVLLGTCECGHTTIKDGQDALGHNYEATYTWSGYEDCEITLICKNDLSHIVIASMTIISEVEKEANCYDEGKRLFIASYIHGGVEYTDIKTEKLEKKEHNFESGACTLCSAMDLDSKNSEIEAENSRYEEAIADNASVFMDLISEVEDEIAYRKSEYNISYVYDSDYCRQKMSEIEEEMTQLKKYIDVYSTGQWDDSVKVKLQKYKVQYAEYKEQYDKYEKMLIINGSYEDRDYYQEEYKECLLELEEIHNANIEAIDKKYECAVNGHTIIIDEAVESTCTEAGFTKGSHCSNCGYVVIEQITINKLEHTKVIDPAIKETCTTDGKTEGSHCSVCGFVIVKQETIEKHHIEVIDPAIKETCTTNGKTEGSHCSVCGEIIISQEVIEKHHIEEIDAMVDSTCSKEGKTEGSHCSICDEIIKEQLVIPMKPHDDGRWISTNIASEIERICNGCGVVLEIKSVTPGLEYTLNDDGISYSVTGCGNLNKESTIIIPDVYNNLPVVSISSIAFKHCNNVTNIVLPNSITSIGDWAFNYCSSLTNINIPDSVTYIGMYAFSDCVSLTSISIPESVTVINEGVFSNCKSLETINTHDKLTSIGDYSFETCKNLTKIVIPEGVTYVGSQAFYGCSSLTIYCEAESEPFDWVFSWNFSECPVIWGYEEEKND